MQPITCLLLAGTLVASAVSAAPIKLSVQGVVQDRFGGQSWWSGSGSGIGATAYLDVYYDSATAPNLSSPWDPARDYDLATVTSNRWNLRYGDLDLWAPIDRITVYDTALWVSFFDFASYSALDLELRFAAPLSNLDLPTGPLPTLEGPLGTISGMYPSWFSFDTMDGWGLEPGTLLVAVTSASAADVAPPQAVPDGLSTSLSGLAVIALCCLRRRRRDPS